MFSLLLIIGAMVGQCKSNIDGDIVNLVRSLQLQLTAQGDMLTTLDNKQTTQDDLLKAQEEEIIKLKLTVSRVNFKININRIFIVNVLAV